MGWQELWWWVQDESTSSLLIELERNFPSCWCEVHYRGKQKCNWSLLILKLEGFLFLLSVFVGASLMTQDKKSQRLSCKGRKTVESGQAGLCWGPRAWLWKEPAPVCSQQTGLRWARKHSVTESPTKSHFMFPLFLLNKTLFDCCLDTRVSKLYCRVHTSVSICRVFTFL